MNYASHLGARDPGPSARAMSIDDSNRGVLSTGRCFPYPYAVPPSNGPLDYRWARWEPKTNDALDETIKNLFKNVYSPSYRTFVPRSDSNGISLKRISSVKGHSQNAQATAHDDLRFQTFELPLDPYHNINKVPHIGQRLRSPLPLRVLIFDSDSHKEQWMRRAEAILELVSAALSFLSASGPLTVTFDSKHSWFPLMHVIVETTFRIFRRAPVDPDPSFRQVRLGGWLAKFYRRTGSKTK
ncbi:hypothetical protein C8J56DRAFT_1062034 [Mycena floridula]|nr:hypothetical protein C8J56DRAFT_1062034 [Mycena floridula]